jgi:hypothetical protein
MNDKELDQILDRWNTPLPSRGFRPRVLGSFPERRRLIFGRPLRWAGAMAILMAMLAVGMEQAQRGGLDNLANGVRQFGDEVGQWFDDMWIAHIMMAFRNSQPKVFVGGELRTDAIVGGKMGGLWVQFPVEGRYWVALRLGTYRGPWTPARFDGHALEFQAAGKMVRIESRRHYGFGGPRTMYMLGPAAPR